jgi:probable DNA repair protein
VQLTPALVDLCATHTIVTPNERLAREFIHSYDRHQASTGRTAWPTVQATSLRRFLTAELHRHVERSGIVTPLIDADALLTLFFNHAPEGYTALSRTALEAFQTVCRYRINTQAPELQSTRGRLFGTWIDRVRHATAGSVLLDQVGDHLRAREVRPTRPIVLLDFDQLTTVERDYLEFAATGQEILCVAAHDRPEPFSPDLVRPPQPITDPIDFRVIACQNVQEEVARAAQWAYAIKAAEDSKDPARIGIVIPNLAEHYAMVQRQFGAMLDPERGSATMAFDLSAGTALTEQPVWRHARALLHWTFQRATPDEVAVLAQSPYLRLDFLASLLSRWPAHLRKHVALRDLRRNLDAHGLGGLTRSLPSKATLAEWTDHCLEILALAGWPNTSEIASFQYQAYLAVLDVLQKAARADGGRATSLEHALELVDTLMAARTFAPERSHADVHVLGMLETTGLDFTHLWVVGMDEESFPQPVTTNLFLPRALLARAGVPRSSQASELDFAEGMLARWQSQTSTLACSYTAIKDESERRPSPLLNCGGAAAQTPVLTDWHPFFVPGNKTPETLVDLSGSAVSPGPARGGVGFLREQAICPFRAYAIHRLGLRDARAAVDFPDPLARGIHMHELLAALLRDAPSKDELLRLDEAHIRALASATLQRLAPNLPDPFKATEETRLVDAVSAWLSTESNRDDFRAIHVEAEFVLALEGLEFSVRVDRIDRTDSGLIVIDYKTGQIRLTGAQTSPPEDPQLPAYSLVAENVAGVYYAQIREGNVRVAGIAANPAFAGARTVSPNQAWPDQIKQWRSDLAFLAHQITRGDARVAPIRGACNTCHLQSFCRIGEDP